MPIRKKRLHTDLQKGTANVLCSDPDEFTPRIHFYKIHLNI